MLTIVTINYNSSKITLKLLESLAVQTDKDFRVIVVDNASEESDFENLKNPSTRPTYEFGRLGVEFIRNSDNLGFSGGNNVGIKGALKNGSNWVLLLNNDTWTD